MRTAIHASIEDLAASLAELSVRYFSRENTHTIVVEFIVLFIVIYYSCDIVTD